MSKLAIVEATYEDVELIAETLRAKDRDEFEASHGHHDYVTVFRQAIDMSVFSYSVFDSYGRIVAIFGAAPLAKYNPLCGICWLVTGDAIEDNRFEFARGCKKIGLMLYSCFLSIMNYVDTRYDESIRWLEWMGFEQKETIELNGVPFVRMEREYV